MVSRGFTSLVSPLPDAPLDKVSPFASAGNQKPSARSGSPVPFVAGAPSLADVHTQRSACTGASAIPSAPHSPVPPETPAWLYQAKVQLDSSVLGSLLSALDTPALPSALGGGSGPEHVEAIAMPSARPEDVWAKYKDEALHYAVATQSHELAAQLLWEDQAKITVRLHLLAGGFYTWCFTLSRWRCAVSDDVAASVHAAKELDARLCSCFGRWRTASLLWHALQMWIRSTLIALRAGMQHERGLRRGVERSVLQLRLTLALWAARTALLVARQKLLVPSLRRWAAAAARRRAYRSPPLVGLGRWLRESLAIWSQWTLGLERARSAALRGVIHALERAMLHWRVWAGAQRKWLRWAGELAHRQKPLVKRREEHMHARQVPRSADGAHGALMPRQPAHAKRLGEQLNTTAGEVSLEPPMLSPSLHSHYDRSHHRNWTHSAALRWDVASSGFADELRSAHSRASQLSHELRSARQQHSRRLQLALGDSRRVGSGGGKNTLTIW